MRLTIMRRTALLIALPACMMALVSWHTLTETHVQVRDLRSSQATAALESSLSLLARQQARVADGALTEAQAQAEALSMLRALRYNDGVGYVAVTDDALWNILHPIDPAIEGVYAADFLTADGRYIVREATALGKRDGIGILRYLFAHPETGEHSVKISAIGRFDPWGWTLYAGVFDEGIEAALARITQQVAAVTAATIALLLLLGLWYGRSLAQPLRALTRAMRAIAEGRHDLRVPHTDATGEIGAAATALAALRDDSAELVATKRRLETALDAERQAARRQREFISMVSHEFRTPLAIIDSAARRLKRRRVSLRATEIDASIDTMRSAVARLIRLMDRTLDTSREEAGAITLHCVDLDLSDLIDEAVRGQRALNPQARIDLAPPTAALRVHADPRLLRSVFETLVANVVTASGDPPHVRLHATSRAGVAVVEVCSSGVGIDVGDPPSPGRRPFCSGHAADASGTETGVQLSMTIARLHGGSISVASPPGEGAVFTLRLPTVSAASALAVAAAS